MATTRAVNPCCIEWERKYNDVQDKRKLLREGLKKQGTIVQKLKEALEGEQEKSKNAAEEKTMLEEDKASLEEEIAALRSDIDSLKDKDRDCLRDLESQVSEAKLEINRLEGLLEIERRKTASVEVEEEKNTTESLKIEESGDVRSKLDLETGEDSESHQAQVCQLEGLLREERNQHGSLDVEMRKVVEDLRRETDELRLKLVSEQGQVSEGVAEINRLEGLLEIERRKTASVEVEEEKKTVESLKIEESQAQICLLEGLLREERNKHASLDVEMRKVLEDLSREADVLRLKLVSEQSQVSEGVAEINRLEGLLEIERRKTASVEVEEEKNMVESLKIEESQAQICLLEGLLREERNKHAAVDVEMREVVEDLRREADELRLEMVSEKDQVSEGVAEINRLEGLLVEERSKAAAMEAEMKNVKREVDEVRSKLVLEQADLQSLQARVSEGKSEINRLEGILTKERSKAAAVEAEMKNVKREVDEVRSKLVLEQGADIQSIQARVSEGKAEINRLEGILTKERSKAASVAAEKKKLKREVDKLKSDLQSLQAQVVKGRAEVTMLEGLLTKERSKAASEEAEMKTVKKEVDELRSKLELEMGKLDEGKKKFEAANRKADRERKRLDDNRKKTEEQKHQVEELSKLIEERNQKIGELLKDIKVLSSAKKSNDNVCKGSSPKSRNAESAAMKLLEKQLKFEKKRVKHAKEVAMFEKTRSSVLLQELGRLKLEFVQFSRHLDLVDNCFLPNISEEIKNTDTGDMNLLCRKRGRNYAVNSSMSSLSDGQLTGSREKGAFSDTPLLKFTDGKRNMQPTSSNLFGEVPRARGNENVILVADNSLNPDRIDNVVGEVTMHGKNRMVDAVEPCEYLNLEGKKLHQQIKEKLQILPSILNSKVDASEEGRCIVPNLRSCSDAKHRLSKKRKKSDVQNEALQKRCSDASDGGRCIVPIPKSSDAKHSKKRKTSLVENAALQKTCSDAKHRLSKKRKTPTVDNAALQHSYDICSPGTRENIETHDDINLCKQTSSTVTDFQGSADGCNDNIKNCLTTVQDTKNRFDDIADVDYLKLLEFDDPVDEERYRIAMERPMSPTLPQLEFQNVEKLNEGCFRHLVDPSSRAPDTLEKSSLYMNGGSVNVQELEKGRIDFENGMQMRKDTEFGERINYEKSKIGSVSGTLCVVLPCMKNSSSITRIFCATKTCIAQCATAYRTDWAMQNILHVLNVEENILPMEKACVFFSLLIQNFCEAAFCKFGKSWDSVSCFDSFIGHVRAVLSDIETRSLFTKLFCSDELFALMEEFLIDAKGMVYEDISSETVFESDSKILLEDMNITLSSKDASPDQLVAGSIIFVSICTAINHMGIISEAAYNIFRARWRDASMTLTILHVFAYLGGEKLFSSSNCLIMTVVKSLVTYLERAFMSVPTTSLSSISNKVKFHPCDKCPFEDTAVAVDSVTSFLLEKLQSFALSGGNDVEYPMLTNSLNSAHTFPYKFSDILALVELVVCVMSWDWTCAKVVPQLLKMLELDLAENFSTAIIILLGQIGMRGVDAGGYQEKRVENLRCKLCAFLGYRSTIRAGLHTQIATVTALIGLLPFNFEELIGSNIRISLDMGQSISADTIRDWYSLLNSEKQALSCNLLQSIGSK